MFASRQIFQCAAIVGVLGWVVITGLQPATHVIALDGAVALTWIPNPATGHEYAVLTDCAGWQACETAALGDGAHLVTVNDSDEQAWLVSQFGGTDHYWIGLSDEAVTDAWVWASGEPLIYTNWHTGEPSHSGGTEHYVLMNWAVPGEWNDGHGLASTIAILERMPIATATATVVATNTALPPGTATPTPTFTQVPQPFALFLVAVYRQDQGLLPGN